MPRKVNGTAGHSVEKKGEAVGGGPVGSQGGYQGRPGGKTEQAAGKPQDDRGVVTNAAVSALGKAAAAGLASAVMNSNKKPSGSSQTNHQTGTYRPQQGYTGGNGGGNYPGGNGGSGNRNGGGLNLKKLLRIAIIAIIVIFVLKSCMGSSNNYNSSSQTNTFATQAPVIQTPAPVIQTPAPVVQTPTPQASMQNPGYSGNSAYGFDLSSLLGGYTNVNQGISSTGWTQGGTQGNQGVLNTNVAPGSRAKFYTPRATDKTTIMVYMCGTDLESGSGMATSDLQEMASSSLSNDVNLLIYAGGCSKWQNNLMSTKTNMVYQLLPGGQFKTLADGGNVAMTKPETLADYIQFCAKNFPAERNILIFWDHGGGSLTGYGYDQKFKNAGSMTLDGIDKALKAGGVKFDFIGFDACLMATAETALMCSDYADYLIASEESEPGIGWYYTNWLTKLSNNKGVSTLELGKQIVDDFVDVCAQKCRGQDTTLAVIDLAELCTTLPTKLNNFSTATTAMIQNNQYKTVSTARGSAKEFAASSRIDQVDLANLAYNLNTDAGNDLANTIINAVKYNRTSNTVNNAYGLSIYFPYRSVSSVKSAISTYNSIGMDSEYSRCIQAYATYASSGQASSGGYSSPFGSLLGSGYGSGAGYSTGSGYSSGYGSNYGSSSYGSGYGSSYSSGYNSGYTTNSGSSYGSNYTEYADIASLLMQMMSGRSLGNVRGLTDDNSGFISDTYDDGTLNTEDVAQFISVNQFNDSNLVWTKGEDGNMQISLSEDQWALVQEVMLNLFIDDGAGYIDLGLDLNQDYFTSKGALNGTFDGIWMGLNDWNCAFYLESIVNSEDGCVATGRIPVLYNGVRANLIVEIVDDEPSIVGVRYDYRAGETGTIAKSLAYRGDELEFSIDGDTATMPKSTDSVAILKSDDVIELVADYYDYNNNYSDSYRISDPITVGDGLQIGYLYLQKPETANACFRFTDIYSQVHWTPMMENA